MAATKRLDNRQEAEVLISYAKAEFEKPELAYFVVHSILMGVGAFRHAGERSIAKLLDARTSYIRADVDADVEIEDGDWGLPVYSGGERSVSVEILDEKNLISLEQELDAILYNTEDKISKFVIKNHATKWICVNMDCKRPIGELSGDGIKKWLGNFRIGKYKECHECETMNMFTIDKFGTIVFNSHPIDSRSKP